MPTEGKSRKLLRIHRDDNVLIVVTPVGPGDRDIIDGHEVVKVIVVPQRLVNVVVK